MPCTVAKACSGKSREAKQRSAQASALGPILRAWASRISPWSGSRMSRTAFRRSGMCSARVGVAVGPGQAAMDGDAFAAAVEEQFDHTLADPGFDGATDMAGGRGVVVALDPHVAVRRDLADDPLSPLPGLPGQWGQRDALGRLEAGRGGSPRSPSERPLSRSSSRRIAAFIVSSEKKVSWRNASRMRDCTAPTAASTMPLSVGRPGRGGQHREAVMQGELAEARVQPRLLAAWPVHARLEVVHDPAPRHAAEVLQRPAMRHRPVTDLLVRHGLGPGQPGVGQDRNEDLHIPLAATGAQRQRLAREVRQAIQPGLVGKAHLRFRTTAAETLLQQRAELAVAIRLPRPAPAPRPDTRPKAGAASDAHDDAPEGPEAPPEPRPSQAGHERPRVTPADKDGREAPRRQHPPATARTDRPTRRAPVCARPSPC